jgi:hypothetical protein
MLPSGGSGRFTIQSEEEQVHLSVENVPLLASQSYPSYDRPTGLKEAASEATRVKVHRLPGLVFRTRTRPDVVRFLELELDGHSMIGASFGSLEDVGCKVVGVPVGELDGTGVVGAPVGVAVGVAVVGALVGVAVGLAVVGALVGVAVGVAVVGALVGVAVGLAVVGALVVELKVGDGDGFFAVGDGEGLEFVGELVGFGGGVFGDKLV